MNNSKINQQKEYLSSQDLVDMGLWPTINAVFMARSKGNSPEWIKIGRRILYKRSTVEDYIKNRIVKRPEAE